MSMLLTVLAALSFSFGGYYMKLAEGFTRFLPSLMIFVLFAVGIGFQTLAMRHTPMTITYVISLGLETILALLLGVIFLQEGYSLSKLAGTGFVFIGILLLRSS